MVRVTGLESGSQVWMGCDLSVSVWFSKFTEPDVLVKHMMMMLLQNFRVTDAIQKVAESYKCKPIEGKLSRILLHWPPFFYMSPTSALYVSHSITSVLRH